MPCHDVEQKTSRDAYFREGLKQSDVVPPVGVEPTLSAF